MRTESTAVANVSVEMFGALLRLLLKIILQWSKVSRFFISV